MKDISLKALTIGISSIVIMGLTLQLIFLLLATAYAHFIKDHPDLTELGTMVSYAAGISGYFIIMYLGGYITAHLAQKKIMLHCFIVSSSVIGLSLITSVRSDNFTYMSIIFSLTGLIFTLAGGRAWSKKS